MTSLSSIAISKQAIIGEDAQKLGTYQGPWYFKRKVYLSYEGFGKWEIKELNLLQVFFRSVFGCYKNTHLQFVSERLFEKQSAKSSDLSALIKRMTQVFAKTFCKSWGRSEFDQAGIIGFAENHTDVSTRYVFSEILNKHYREGDIVLFEGVDTKDKITSDMIKEIFPILKKDIDYNGWDIDLNEDPQVKESSLRSTISSLVQSAFPNETCNFEEGFINFKQAFKTRYGIDLDPQETHSDEARAFLEKFNQAFSTVISGDVFQRSSEKIKLLDCVLYKSVDFAISTLNEFKTIPFSLKIQDMEAFGQQIITRNKKLNQTVQQYLDKGKRVFVIAGAAHLLPLENFEKSYEPVSRYLKDKTYHLIFNKEKIITSFWRKVYLFLSPGSYLKFPSL